ncbi:protein chain elongation factor EF-Ts [Candidatus Competibacter denitrificans Run_A_D11]|uniref:Elongation factor Ts n=1 Tax=Candidatus Competibacter denitrificans Run_A_D11 TaxID=1400863 RepID=W6MDZ0_9GAMM|nr:translation elongation factor Ts [Candidatus Competibacter denitrificans]CDI03698.1 protein chain elongation factor EF-Ts [Candidatus Competibacter denitrificans Run_A_D11]HRC68376.1 translation elongation factor Ts [Candidatus Competibacter denitrificans]
MADITAALVKELRERTGSGMMECKRALQETGGDIEAAVELMRKAGQAKADKKASRVAAEGLIAIKQTPGVAAMAEINCETDFVTKNDDFRTFVDAVTQTALTHDVADLDALLAAPMADGQSVERNRRDCIAKIGENINVRRVARFASDKGVLGCYLHGTRIGVLVELDGGDAELAKDIAMHIAASRPLCVSAEQVPAGLIAKEKEIYAAQATEEAKDKPAHVIEKIVGKIVEGKLRKYLESITLLGQAFVKNPDQSVEELLGSHQAKIVRFERFELGEGIEKKADNFAAEVMAQVRGD